MHIPYWRYVRYTDDGCALYQCLNCSHQWESRTEPGWYDSLEHTYQQPVGDEWTHITCKDKPEYWFRNRKDPIYRPVFFFCPFCGVQWKGPIKCNVDNEYMYGPRRLKIQHATRQHEQLKFKDDNRHRNRECGTWWVIQVRYVNPFKPNQYVVWYNKSKIRTIKANAVQIWKYIKDELEYLQEQQERYDEHDEPTELRAIIVRVTTAKPLELYTINNIYNLPE